MQTTIYIRKENEERWEALGKKRSDFVNDALSSKKWVLPEVIQQELQKPLVGPTPRVAESYPPSAPESVPEPLKQFERLEELIFCKHGANPKFCKFAKPGKVCK